MIKGKSKNSVLASLALAICLGVILLASSGSVMTQESRQPDSIEINRRPFDDFARYVTQQTSLSDLNLSIPFSVKLDGHLTSSGALDPKRSKIVSSDGDPALIDLAKRGIEAIGDSGFLGYLQSLSVERTVIEVSQSDGTMSLSLRSEVKNEQMARTIASGINMTLQVGRVQSRVEDEKYLLEHTSVKSEGAAFIVSIFAPSAIAKELLLRK